MDNGMDMNAANDNTYSADVTSDTLEVKQITSDGNATANATLERSLSQAADHGPRAHAASQDIGRASRTIAERARAVNDSNTGAKVIADNYV